MINTIKPGDETTKTNNIVGKTVADELNDENNVVFDGDKVQFPATEFANIQEALEYVKKQENLLVSKNRENKSEALKEIYHVFDLMEEEMKRQNKLSEEKYNTRWREFEFSDIEQLKNNLREYEWDISNFLSELAEKWKPLITMNVGWGDEGAISFQSRFGITGENLEGESLVKAFVSELENLEKIPWDQYHYDILLVLNNKVYSILNDKDGKYKQNPFK